MCIVSPNLFHFASRKHVDPFAAGYWLDLVRTHIYLFVWFQLLIRMWSNGQSDVSYPLVYVCADSILLMDFISLIEMMMLIYYR